MTRSRKRETAAFRLRSEAAKKGHITRARKKAHADFLAREKSIVAWNIANPITYCPCRSASSRFAKEAGTCDRCGHSYTGKWPDKPLRLEDDPPDMQLVAEMDERRQLMAAGASVSSTYMTVLARQPAAKS